MTAFTTEIIDVEPWFDMELFMGGSQETRLGGDVMERFMALWKNWLPHLTVKGIDTGKIKYLLVALDEAVEQDADKAWESSPANAFLYNALAQTMCMAAVHAVIPEVQDAGCAPAPKPTAALREALGERFGLDDRQTRPKVTTLYAQALERAFPELYTHVTPLVSREEAEIAADEIKKQKAARGERKSEKPETPAEGGEQPAARRRRKSEQE